MGLSPQTVIHISIRRSDYDQTDRQTNRETWGEGVGCSLTLHKDEERPFCARHTDRQGGVPLATVQKLHIWKQLEQMGNLAKLFL